MPCDIKLQITSYNSEKNVEEQQFKTIKKGVGEDQPLLFSDIAEYIMRLPKKERATLASKLRQAKVQKLTNTDVKNHNFISNTTIDALKNKYPDLNQLFPDLIIKPTDNYTIINCSKMELNGSAYFGRTLDSNGKEIFFINGFYGAQHFLNYLDIKGKIEKFLDDSESELYQKHFLNLKTLSEKFNTNPKQLMIDYLNNQNQYKPYQDNNKVIIPKKIINQVLADLKNQYNLDNDKTDLQILLESVQKQSKNTFDMSFTPKNLFDTLFLGLHDQTITITNTKQYDTEFYQEPITLIFKNNKILVNKIKHFLSEDGKWEEHKIKEEIDSDKFTQLQQEDLEDILYTAFKNDPKLLRARIKKIKSGETKTKIEEAKEVIIKSQDLEDAWQQIKETSKTKLTSLKTSLKNDPTTVESLLKKHFKKGYTDSEGIIHKNLKFEISDTKAGAKKLKGSYMREGTTKEVKTSGEIVLYFPWNTIGGLYNFAYDTKYLFSPVKKEDDSDLEQDGMYKGAYIYEYYNKKSNSTHFAISRHIISPKSYMHTYSSLEAAKHKIDSWNDTQIIKEQGMYSIKQHKSTPRTSYIESDNVSEGQIITTLNLELPSIPINKFPALFRGAFNSTLPSFYNLFNNVDNIEQLNTPEKAVAFLFKFYKLLNLSERENLKNNNINDLKDVIEAHNKDAQDIIQEINNADTVSYQVERIFKSKTKGNLAVLSLLQNNGNNVQVEGKYSDSTPANSPTIANMEQAIHFFNSKFGLNIITMTQQELIDFDKNNNLGLHNKFSKGGIRAFIYNGQIYINSSNSNMSDLFHEISHVFFGMIKIKYPEAYQTLMNKYMNSKEFVNNFRYIDSTYKNFSRQDQIEETVVDLIASKMFNKQSLVSEFKGLEFIKDFDYILNKLPQIMKEQVDNGLGFEGFMQTMLKDKDNISKLNRNMKISQVFHALKNNGKIKEICD